MQSPHDAMEPVLEAARHWIVGDGDPLVTAAICDLVIRELEAIPCGPWTNPVKPGGACRCARCKRLAEWRAIRDR